MSINKLSKWGDGKKWRTQTFHLGGGWGGEVGGGGEGHEMRLNAEAPAPLDQPLVKWVTLL